MTRLLKLAIDSCKVRAWILLKSIVLYLIRHGSIFNHIKINPTPLQIVYLLSLCNNNKLLQPWPWIIIFVKLDFRFCRNTVDLSNALTWVLPPALNLWILSILARSSISKLITFPRTYCYWLLNLLNFSPLSVPRKRVYRSFPKRMTVHPFWPVPLEQISFNLWGLGKGMTLKSAWNPFMKLDHPLNFDHVFTWSKFIINNS